ncbi:MAG: di-trans,poly-cis-decaprenylcistransferase [Parachlamydiaceae bacterium]|nr:di-trans,poly-cis-decaprenylcistransferase [Parachlamydiaceae bacterium]
MQFQSSLTSNEETAIYTVDQLKSLDRGRIPAHIAIIPDGNRRWAKNNNLSVMRGHRQGADNLIEIVKAGKALGIKTITFYIFSTENWAREPIEVRALLWLLESYLVDQRATMIENGVRLHTIGDGSRFSTSVQRTIQETKNATAHCTDIDMVFGLNYGARDELRRAFQTIVEEKAQGKINGEITESMIASYLDTAKWPDPDLLIRTSGEQRISNFLLWQTSYAEFYSVELMWPDFQSKQLLEAILEFQRRERRLGGGK